jgi:hypothetical protein
MNWSSMKFEGCLTSFWELEMQKKKRSYVQDKAYQLKVRTNKFVAKELRCIRIRIYAIG